MLLKRGKGNGSVTCLNCYVEGGIIGSDEPLFLDTHGCGVYDDKRKQTGSGIEDIGQENHEKQEEACEICGTTFDAFACVRGLVLFCGEKGRVSYG